MHCRCSGSNCPGPRKKRCTPDSRGGPGIVLLCFIPRVRKIRNEASSCPGIFFRTVLSTLIHSSSSWCESLSSYICEEYNLIERNPPPSGVSCLLCSLIKEEGPPRSTWYKFFEGGPLPAGSWSGNIVNRKPPPGGGNLSIKVVHFYLTVYCQINRVLWEYGNWLWLVGN